MLEDQIELLLDPPQSFGIAGRELISKQEIKHLRHGDRS
jgi:hypothetical protein